MLSQRRKKKKKSRNRKFCKKQVKIACQLKLFFREMNHLLVLIQTPTHLIYKNDWQISPEIIQSKETSNNDQLYNVTNENNHENIKSSKHPNVSLNGISEKNQPKYIDFPKTLFEKSNRSFSSKEFPWLHYNPHKNAAFSYTCMSANIKRLKTICHNKDEAFIIRG